MTSLPNGWERVGIKDVCESIVDCVNKTAPTVAESTPFRMIRTTNVKSGWINLGEVKYVTEDVYRKWTRRQTPKRGDIVLTREAPLGEAGMLRDDEGVFLGQRLISYRADPDKLDNRFLLYAFQSDDLQGQIKGLGSGATVEHMRVPDAEKLTLMLPPLPVQTRIGDILSAYDDLIENNTRRIAILEEMARALYREWFVEFRFPGHEGVRMVESEVGPIPEGWEVTKIGAVADVNQSSIRAGSGPEFIEYVDISSVSTGRIDKIERFRLQDAPGRARRIVTHGDVIWSTVRPNRRSYCLILNPRPDLIVSTGFAVLTARRIPFTYLFQATTSNKFAEYLTNRATGSAYPAVTGADFAAATVLLPPADLLDAYHEVAVDSLELKDALIEKNRVLGQTRDLLLPKLVAGGINIALADMGNVE